MPPQKKKLKKTLTSNPYCDILIRYLPTSKALSSNPSHAFHTALSNRSHSTPYIGCLETTSHSGPLSTVPEPKAWAGGFRKPKMLPLHSPLPLNAPCFLSRLTLHVSSPPPPPASPLKGYDLVVLAPSTTTALEGILESLADRPWYDVIRVNPSTTLSKSHAELAQRWGVNFEVVMSWDLPHSSVGPAVPAWVEAAGRLARTLERVQGKRPLVHFSNWGGRDPLSIVAFLKGLGIDSRVVEGGLRCDVRGYWGRRCGEAGWLKVQLREGVSEKGEGEDSAVGKVEKGGEEDGGSSESSLEEEEEDDDGFLKF